VTFRIPSRQNLEGETMPISGALVQQRELNRLKKGFAVAKSPTSNRGAEYRG
jgi:hypothetical protein